MTPSPNLRIEPGTGRRLMTGAALNELLAALVARTHLTASGTGPSGVRGLAAQGGGTPVHRPGVRRFDPRRTYLLPPTFLRSLEQLLASRGGPLAAGQVPTGTVSDKEGLTGLLRALQRLTPASPSYTGPDGYRLSTHQRVARLQFEIQERRGYARPCFYSLPDPVEDGYVITRTTTVTCEHGSYTQTYAATGDIESFGPGDTPTLCDEVDYSDTIDPEFDYGIITSTSDDDPLTGWGAAETAAKSAVANDGVPYTSSPYEWPQEAWRAESAVTGRAIFLGAAGSGVGYVPVLGFLGGWNVSAPRYRLHNTGTTILRVTVLFTRTSDFAEESVTTSVPPGQSSAWLDWPATTGEMTWLGSIDRVSMGPRTTPS